MKKILSSRIFLSVFFFLMGCFLTSIVNYFTLKAEQKVTHQLGWPRFFAQMNPFHHSGDEDLSVDAFFKEAEKNMMALQNFDQMGSPGFHQAQSFGGVGDVTQREDDKFIYLDIDFKGQKPKEFKVDVRHGQITVSGLVEHEENTSGFAGSVTSSFHRSFPAPENAKVTTYKLEEGSDKITIKFEKIDS